MPAVAGKFKPGEYVQRVNQPELAGIVRELRWDGQVESWNYLVQFGAQLRAVPEEALEAVTVVESPWESFEQGNLSGKTHLVFTLTYERLKSPPARIAHSFATARTQFYPHQFKPLLKFLDNPGKSILIADDVALGKVLLPIDVLIVDEAHRLRNPETLQHKVGVVLTRSANATVFLTATPVQNKLEDLWNLLKLLSPEEFSEWPLFQEQIKGNRLILAAQKALTTHPPDYKSAKEAVEAFTRSYAPERSGRQFLSSV